MLLTFRETDQVDRDQESRDRLPVGDAAHAGEEGGGGAGARCTGH